MGDVSKGRRLTSNLGGVRTLLFSISLRLWLKPVWWWW